MLARASFVLVLGSSIASAQLPVWGVEATGFKEALGSLVGGAGDMNGDGYDDVFASSYTPPSTRVFSGLDGSLLYTFTGSGASDSQFGAAACAAGDVNGDGYADLLVSDPVDWRGRVWVYSGLDGSVIHALVGSENGEGFGTSMARIGDVDQDGKDDFIISAPLAGFQGSGRVTVFSGRTGAVLHELKGGKNWYYGRRVSATGDVNGDGIPDFAVAKTKSLIVTIYSGLDATPLRTYSGAKNSNFGLRMAHGDLNGDGTPDLLVAAPHEGKGVVYAYSGLDGSELFSIHAGEYSQFYAYGLDVPGDLDGDGRDDFVLGTMLGRAEVYSGGGELLYRLRGGDQSGWYYGSRVAGAGDVNGDGLPDLVLGDNKHGLPALEPGAVFTFSGWNPLGSSYCGPAAANSTGLSGTIEGLGSATVFDDLLILSARQLPPQQFGYFLVSATQGLVVGPGGSQGNLCLGGNIGRYSGQVQNSGPGGAVSLTVDLWALPFTPSVSVQPGETWNFQLWFRDQNPGATSNFTDGLSVSFN